MKRFRVHRHANDEQTGIGFTDMQGAAWAPCHTRGNNPVFNEAGADRRDGCCVTPALLSRVRHMGARQFNIV